MYFLCNLAVNCILAVNVLFTNEEQATSRRSVKLSQKFKEVCENNYERYMLKQLFTSLSMNSVAFQWRLSLLKLAKYRMNNLFVFGFFM